MRNGKVMLNMMTVTFVIVYMNLMTGCQTANTTDGSIGKVSHQSANTIVSALFEASVGGEPGLLIEKQMDKQAGELLSALKGVHVERLAEGILITMDAGTLFERDSYGLHSTKNLRALASALKKYGYTNTLIEAHTDSTGEEVYNQSLSEKRAHEVEEYLLREGIKSGRIKARGYGERQPLTGNNTEAARLLNRRLEIAIFANDEMKNLAMTGKVGSLTASNR